MTKTKRQLRAEAVERLSNFESTDEGDGYYWDLTRALLGKRPIEYDTSDDMVSAIIDLLTDDEPTGYGIEFSANLDRPVEMMSRETVYDGEGKAMGWIVARAEPPEGDAVYLIRKLAMDFQSDVYKRDESDYLEQLADMVERDYVRRGKCEAWKKLVKQWEALYDEVLAERDTLQGALDIAVQNESRLERERDGLKRAAERDADVIEALNVRLSDVEAERDEWKARAEGSGKARAGENNMEWLYRTNREFRRFALAFASVETDGDAAEWLMSEHVDRSDGSSSNETGNGTCPDGNETCPDGNETASNGRDLGQDADMSEISADCVRDGGETSEVDTREKLEADVRQYANPSGGTGTLGACWEKKMLAFLDRQAAITERGSHYRIEDLSHDCEMWRDRSEDMRMERDGLQARLDVARRELTRAKIDSLRLAARLGDAMAGRDECRAMAGKMLDLAHEIRRMADAGMPEGELAAVDLEGEVVR